MLDVWLVARFELLRAVRTWRALALLAAYAVASGGAARLFVEAVGGMENALATALKVPALDTPGAMLSELVASEYWRQAVVRMTGSKDLADHLVTVPPVALFWLWVAILLTPFFAASTAAECVAIDAHSRALRYELLRTGRLELVFGRFAAQVLLAAAGTCVSMVVVQAVAYGFLLNQSPAELVPALLVYLPRAIAFAVPFVGVGVAASLVTSSAAWARVLALGGVAGSWVGWGLARWLARSQPAVADVLLPLFPQGWLRGLWEPSAAWLGSAVACVALGVAVVAVVTPWFSRRHL